MTQIKIQPADTDKQIADIFLSVYNRMTPNDLSHIARVAHSAQHASMNCGISGQLETAKFLDATVLAAIANMLDYDKKNILTIFQQLAEQRTNSGDTFTPIDPDKFRVVPEFGCVVAIDQKGEILVCALEAGGNMETDDVGCVNWCVADMPEQGFAKYVLREFNLPKKHFYHAYARDQSPEDDGPSP